MSQHRTRNRVWRPATGSTLLGLVLLWSGCRDAQTPAVDPPAKERFIGFIGRSADDPAWRVLRAGAMRYLQAAGPTPIRFEAPKTPSPAAQNAVIRKWTDEGMVALCLDPVDPNLCTAAIEYAYQQGVQTFAMVHDVKSPLRSAFIGPNNAEIGQLLARTTSTALNGKGNVMVIHAGAEDPRTGGRYLSFRSALHRQPGIKVLKWENCQGDPDRAYTLLTQLLIKFPRMNAIVLIDNWPFRQRGVDAFQVPRTCKIISTTSTPPYWPFIEKGLCYSLIGIDYGRIGYTAMRLAKSAEGPATGGDRREYVASRVVLENNLAQYKMDWRTWATFPDE